MATAKGNKMNVNVLEYSVGFVELKPFGRPPHLTESVLRYNANVGQSKVKLSADRTEEVGSNLEEKRCCLKK